MRVGLDLSGTRRQRLTGWERFALEYASALERSSPPGCVPVRLGDRHRPGGRIRTHLQQLVRYVWAGRREAEHSAVDVFHALTFPVGDTGVPTVWTVHDDLVLGGHPEYARAGSKLWDPLARRALRWTDRVVTDTRSVALELVELGLPEETLSVVSPGVPELGDPVRPMTNPVRLVDGRETELPGEFLLAVGTIEKRKCPDVAALVAEESGAPIIFVGRLDPSFEFEVPPRRALRMEGISDPELSWLYRNALATIAPSAYEGFDFPVAEALSVGAPVIASDIPVHREVAKGSAQYFPVGDVDAAVRSLEKATMLRDQVRVEVSSWEQCANGYLDVYRSAVDGS